MQNAKKMVLKNGLTVIYEKNENADVVALNVGIKVGSVHETEAESGICHLIEHMVFKGTTSYKAGEIATLVESNGGELNAYTSLDQTVYYINLPAKNALLGLQLLKEMVFDAQFDAVELEREKEVVVEEIRRGADSPQRVLSELLFQNVFQKHNYHRPVIGTEKHVRGFSQKKISSFYKKYYTPDNMILGVCGNISEANLKTYLNKTFVLPKIKTRKINPSMKANQAFRQFHMDFKSMEVNASYFDLAFSAPKIGHEDIPALDTLSHILGEGGASLLEQNTKENLQLVNYIYSGVYSPRYAGVFVIGGQTENHKLNLALKSVVEQIEWIRNHLVSVKELQRIKLLARAQMIFDKQTCQGTVRKWMNYETTIGSYDYEAQYIEAIEKLTPQDIKRVAQKYLNLSQSTLVVLHPEKQKPKIDKKIFLQKDLKKKTYPKLAQKKGIVLSKLDNGLRVLIKENDRLPLFSMKLVSEGGLRFESPQTNGWSALMANTLTKGCAKYDQKAIMEVSEDLAANLSAYAGRNSWGGSFTGLSEKIHESMQFFSDVFLQPLFSEDELAKERHLQIQAISNRKDNPAQMAFYHSFQNLFLKHPYAMSTLGKEASLKKANSLHLRKFYEQFFVPENLVMSVVGDVEKRTVLEKLNETFGQIPKQNFKNKKIIAPKLPSKRKNIFVPMNKNQSHLVVGFLGASFKNPDRYALEVLNHLFSGQGGRLFLELRDKQSLAYSVSSMIVEGMETGFFGFYIGSEPKKVSQALSGIFSEIEKVQTEKISTFEVERAKNYIIGNFAIDHQRNGDMAMQLALNELYQRPIADYFDYTKAIQKVTASDLQRVARKYLKLDRPIVTLVGPDSPF